MLLTMKRIPSEQIILHFVSLTNWETSGDIKAISSDKSLNFSYSKNLKHLGK